MTAATKAAMRMARVLGFMVDRCALSPSLRLAAFTGLQSFRAASTFGTRRERSGLVRSRAFDGFDHLAAADGIRGRAAIRANFESLGSRGLLLRARAPHGEHEGQSNRDGGKAPHGLALA